ncbi:MAG: class I SAM-dependent methyltransferase [Acidobacteriota bacterium]
MAKHVWMGGSTVPLEYPVYPEPRYGYGKAPHQQLWNLLDSHRSTYRNSLEWFLTLSDQLLEIGHEASNASVEPTWNNSFFYSIDAISLYGFLGKFRPATLIEIGSGNSTRFARRAVKDFNLETAILSIDPFPRVEIERVSDRIIREPLQSTDLSLFERLGAGDFVFFDGSHMCFTNSDVTVFFLEVLPFLKRGVIVQIHDIWLPYDYPPQWNDRFYSEQYLLACYLLADESRLAPILANAFFWKDEELGIVLDPLLERLGYTGWLKYGTSFWFTCS